MEEKKLLPNAFMEHNRIRITRAERDYAELELTVGPDSLNPYGAVHGGAYFTMADCCAGMTARSDGRWYVTQSADVHFLRSARAGTLTARSRLIRRGGSVCVVEVQITDEAGTLMFHSTFSMFCIEK